MNKMNDSPKKKSSLLSLLNLKKKKPLVSEVDALNPTTYELDGLYRNDSNPINKSTNVSLCCAITETSKMPSEFQNRQESNEPDVCSSAETNTSHKQALSLGLNPSVNNEISFLCIDSNSPSTPSLKQCDSVNKIFSHTQPISSDSIVSKSTSINIVESKLIRPLSSNTLTHENRKNTEVRNNSMDSLARQALFAVQVLHLIPTSDVKER